LKCGFNDEERGGEEVTINGVAIPRVVKFRYFGLIIEDIGDIDEDHNQRIRVG